MKFKNKAAFVTKCTAVANRLKTNILFVADPAHDYQFEAYGRLHIRRFGLRAAFEIASHVERSQNVMAGIILELLRLKPTPNCFVEEA